MIPNARARVALAYTALFGVVVFATAAGVYWLIHDNAYLPLDQTLESTVEVATVTLIQEFQTHKDKAQSEEALREAVRARYLTSFPQEQIAIWDGSRLVAYKRFLGRHQKSLASLPPSGRARIEDVGDLRVQTRHISIPEVNTTYTVAVSTWRGDVLNDMRSVFRALVITVPASLLIAAVGGFILAKQTLAPLTSMAASVDVITSSNLDQRIPVADPNDELGQLAIRFNKLLERLQESFEQQRRFMADAAHELKTPITAALTAAQVTLQGGHRNETEYREALRITEEQMSRLKRIVQDMFLLAQADANAIEHRLETVYLDEIVAEGCRAMRFLAEGKGLEMHMSEMPELRCTGDAGLLRQAIINLLDNARMYTQQNGRIEVSAEVRPATFVLRIADTGPGIPESAKPHLFERFYRVEKSRSRTSGDGSGAGLGLAIAKWVADIHRGDLRLESSDASGSTFALEIPRS
ncbi:MAG: ATP-binding protein [Acidobacteriota bacterium]|nr:ATP-binding protein [Acidobacteriota bacterium]